MAGGRLAKLFAVRTLASDGREVLDERLQGVRQVEYLEVPNTCTHSPFQSSDKTSAEPTG